MNPASIIFFAIAAGFGTIFVRGIRKGTLPFWAFPIQREKAPELFWMWAATLAFGAVCCLIAAAIAVVTPVQ